MTFLIGYLAGLIAGACFLAAYQHLAPRPALRAARRSMLDRMSEHLGIERRPRRVWRVWGRDFAVPFTGESDRELRARCQKAFTS